MDTPAIEVELTPEAEERVTRNIQAALEASLEGMFRLNERIRKLEQEKLLGDLEDIPTLDDEPPSGG